MLGFLPILIVAAVWGAAKYFGAKSPVYWAFGAIVVIYGSYAIALMVTMYLIGKSPH